MLPRICNPTLLASRGERLRGAHPVGELHRFRRAVDHASGPVQVDLHFRQDESGLTRVGGHLEVPVRLTCQRCLEPLELLLDAAVDMLVVRSEGEAERHGQGREAVRLEGHSLPLLELMEDELMLALPMHASHPAGHCSPPAFPAPRSAESETAAPAPFSSLSTLIHSNPT